jgi:Protein of unknown function (DUF2865)
MRHLIRLGIAAALLAASPGTVLAQGFFDMLFGGPKPAQPAPSYGNPSRLLPPQGSTRSLYTLPERSFPSPAERDDATPSEGKGSVFRTVCVRMCDGYYWPVSFATVRSRMHRDANACRASCGDEAKLFFMPSPTGQIEDAVDLTGRTYGRLPNAFRYRKALVSGCSCRPEPWSDAEMMRHERYALAEAETRRKEQDKAGADQAGPGASIGAGSQVYGPPAPTELLSAQAETQNSLETAPQSKAQTREPRPVRQVTVQRPQRPQAMRVAAQRQPPASWGPPVSQGMRWPGD